MSRLAVALLAVPGAAGPTGSRYGHAAGHACFVVARPVELARTLETSSADRVANRQAFAIATLELMADVLAFVGLPSLLRGTRRYSGTHRFLFQPVIDITY